MKPANCKMHSKRDDIAPKPCLKQGFLWLCRPSHSQAGRKAYIISADILFHRPSERAHRKIDYEHHHHRPPAGQTQAHPDARSRIEHLQIPRSGQELARLMAYEASRDFETETAISWTAGAATWKASASKAKPSPWCRSLRRFGHARRRARFDSTAKIKRVARPTT